MKKFLIACVILLLACYPVMSAPDYDIAGSWNVQGTGFAEKGFVRVSLELTGSMNLTTQTIDEIKNDLTEIISDELTIKVDPEHDKWLESDMKALTEYNINLRLNATMLDIKAWEEYLPNGIKIPVLLPEMRPTVNDPFSFPAYTYDDIRYQLTITGTESGVLNLNGYIDVDTVGKCELNASCSVWKTGSSKPQSENKSSGCNSGWGLLASIALIGVIKLVWN